MKTAGELWASCIRFLVIKTETGLLKRDEPKQVKGKTFLVASTLIIILLISTTSVSTNHFENWSFVEGLYAWFTTLTTIGFGDYVHLESLTRKVDHGETSKTRLIFYCILFELPYLVGLSLMSCTLTCLVDSMDQMRDLYGHYMKYCLSCKKWRSSKVSVAENVNEEDNQVYDISQQIS